MGKKVARLFEQFQPEHYQLEWDIDREAMSFQGSVTVRGRKTGRPSQRLTFHQKELKILSATLIKHDKKGQQTVTISRINNHNSLDEVRLHSDEMLYPGEYTVTMTFAGTITRAMNGIYPCFFKHNGHEKKLIATQFESHHAREAFPCIDEPEAKATFDLRLLTPAGETVLSNTPVKKQATAAKVQTTTFETTPRMSVYLLAFVFGEMKHLEAKTKDGVLVRTYATPDNAGRMQHGLDVTVRGLEFFSDYFGVPYPLPKLDLVALPDFSVGAMENWGLITFRETTMLTDPASSSIESKQLVALVIAHELSHQWFGNLVTMKWWDDLWLNESFANLMEYRAVEALYPEWHIWEQFVSLETGSAKRRDSLADVQPIHTDVNHPDEISTLFDPSIVYAKGGSVLHMLMHYIGELAFRKGLTAYFEKHRYGNTAADDLWAALGTAAGQNVKAFMDNWILRPGYPVVSTEWQPGSSQVSLTQRRFLNDPAAKPANDRPWPVPLAATYDLDKPLLKDVSAKATVTAGKGPFLVNHDGQSYFLPHYTVSAHLQQLIKAVADGQVDPIDRLLLLDNYTMLQRGGLAATTELLELLRGYTHETGESVWGAMAAAIGEARRLIEGDEANEAKLDALVCSLAVGLATELGWEDKPSDSPQTLRLRGMTHSIAASAKDQTILDEGLKRFAGFNQPADLPPSTRTVVYYIGARFGSPADFTKLLKLHAAVTSADEKDELAGALTTTKEPQQYQQLLKLLTTDTVRRQDLLHWYAWLLRNRYARAATWEWMTKNWDWIEQEMSSEKTYAYFPRYAGSIFSQPAELKQFQAFFGPRKQVVALSREISLAEQELGSRIAWRQRNEAGVKAWLKKRSQ